jgi:nicotinamide-nucleotide amidase
MGISTTGVAGPDSDGYKPVGLVYVGVRLPGAAEARVKELHVSGDRAGIRQATVVAAMQFALSLL